MGTVVCIDVSVYPNSGFVIDGILGLVEAELRQRALPKPEMIIRGHAGQIEDIDRMKGGLKRPIVALLTFQRGDEQKVKEAITELRRLTGPDVPVIGYCFNTYWDETGLIDLMAVCLPAGHSTAEAANPIIEALHPTMQKEPEE